MTTTNPHPAPIGTRLAGQAHPGLAGVKVTMSCSRPGCAPGAPCPHCAGIIAAAIADTYGDDVSVALTAPAVAVSGPRGTILTDDESAQLLAEYDWDM